MYRFKKQHRSSFLLLGAYATMNGVRYDERRILGASESVEEFLAASTRTKCTQRIGPTDAEPRC